MRKQEKWKRKRKPPFTVQAQEGMKLIGTPVKFECSIEETARQVADKVREHEERKS